MTKEEKEKKAVAKSAAKPRKRVKKGPKKVEPVSKPAAEPSPAKPEPKTPKEPVGQVFCGTGRRKTAVVQVRLIKGAGKILLNGKNFKDYLDGRKLLMLLVSRPLEVVKMRDKFDVVAVLRGGGIPSQADAARMAIARALLAFNPELKKGLRQYGLLTRDSRMKESKKYGHKRARKRFQYSKR